MRRKRTREAHTRETHTRVTQAPGNKRKETGKQERNSANAKTKSRTTSGEVVGNGMDWIYARTLSNDRGERGEKEEENDEQR